MRRNTLFLKSIATLLCILLSLSQIHAIEITNINSIPERSQNTTLSFLAPNTALSISAGDNFFQSTPMDPQALIPMIRSQSPDDMIPSGLLSSNIEDLIPKLLSWKGLFGILSLAEIIFVSHNISLFLDTLFTSLNIFTPILGLVAIRLTFNLGVIFNEWGHILVGSILGGTLKGSSLSNFMGNLPLKNWIKTLIPFSGFAFEHSPYVEMDNVKGNRSHFTRAGGAILGLALHMGLTALIALNFFPAFTIPLLATGIIVSFIAISSDILPYFLSGVDLKEGKFFCGLFGLKTAANVGYETIYDILLKTGVFTEKRGKQGGGLRIHGEGISTRHVRMVNPDKRAPLTPLLLKTFFNGKLKRDIKKSHSLTLQGHHRFATTPGGAPHPHVWGSDKVNVWEITNGQFKSSKTNMITTVTHNGDFDYLNLGELFKFATKDKITLSSINKSDKIDFYRWLQKSLGSNFVNKTKDLPFGMYNPEKVDGDSVNIAGFMRLYNTYGMWLPSLRLAYYQVLATSIDDFISDAELAKLTEETENIFKEEIKNFDVSDLKSFKDKLLLEFSNKLSIFKHMDKDIKAEFLHHLMINFFQNTHFESAKLFRKAAIGTFAVSVTSNHYKKEDAFFIKGQPQYLAFFEDRSLMANFSEIANTKVLNDKGEPYFRYKLDFNDTQGEVVQVIAGSDKKMHLKLFNGLSQKTYNSWEELLEAKRIIDMKDNPNITPLPQSMRDADADLIERDFNDTLETLEKIDQTFEDKDNTNVVSSESLYDLLESIPFIPKRPSNVLDVVFVAEEVSKEHAATFASTLSKMMGDKLKIRVVAGNEILAADSFNMDKKQITVGNPKGTASIIDEHTLAFNISQSGQTFSTNMAVSLLTRFLNNRVKILTGEFDSQMGRSVGQEYPKEEKPNGNIFVNQAGYRPSEVSNVSSFATHHTLTNILLKIGDRVSKSEKIESPWNNDKPGRLTASPQDRLEKIHKTYVAKIKSSGLYDNKSEINKEINTLAHHWTQNIIESVMSLFMTKGIVFLFVGMQINPAPVALGVTALCFLCVTIRAILGKTNKVASMRTLLKFFTGAIILNGLLLVTNNPWLYALYYVGIFEWLVYAGRVITNRPLTDRIYGGRGILISDASWVQRNAHSGLSKYLANSFGLLSVFIDSSKIINVANYNGHTVKRGSMFFQGLPGNNLTFSKMRKAAEMNAAQVEGIKNFGSGAQVQTIGAGETKRVSKQHYHLSSVEITPDPVRKEFIHNFGLKYNVGNIDNLKMEQILSEENLITLANEWKSFDKMASIIINDLFPERDTKDKGRMLKDVQTYIEDENLINQVIESRYNEFTRYQMYMALFNQISKNLSRLFNYSALTKYIPIRSIKKFSSFLSWNRWMSHNGTRTQTTAMPVSAVHILNIIQEMDQRALSERKNERVQKPVLELVFQETGPNETEPEIEIEVEIIEDEIKQTHQEHSLPEKTKKYFKDDDSDVGHEIPTPSIADRIIFEELLIKATGDGNMVQSLVAQLQVDTKIDHKYHEITSAIEFKNAKDTPEKWEHYMNEVDAYIDNIPAENHQQRFNTFNYFMFRLAIVPIYQESFLSYLQSQRKLLHPHIKKQVDQYYANVNMFLKNIDSTSQKVMYFLGENQFNHTAHIAFLKTTKAAYLNSRVYMQSDYNLKWISTHFDFLTTPYTNPEVKRHMRMGGLRQMHESDNAIFNYLMFFVLKQSNLYVIETLNQNGNKNNSFPQILTQTRKTSAYYSRPEASEPFPLDPGFLKRCA